MSLIVTNEIPGLSVYGVQQVDYTVDGVSGRNYAAAVAAAAFLQAGAIERESEAYSAMVRVRMRKIEELGEALSVIAEAQASMPTDGPESDDLSASDPRLRDARAAMRKYGLDLTLQEVENGECFITREEASLKQNDIQYAIDNEDNSLQQDMVSLEGLVSNRDNAFSTASKLMEKVNNTSQTLIGNFGG